jgi:hypothetical protein
MDQLMDELTRHPQVHRWTPYRYAAAVVVALAAVGVVVAFALRPTSDRTTATTPGIASDIALLRAFDLLGAGWSPDDSHLAIIEQGQAAGVGSLHVYTRTGIELRREDGVAEAVWLGGNELAVLTTSADDSAHGAVAIINVSTGEREEVSARAGRGLVGSSASGRLAIPNPGADDIASFTLWESKAMTGGIPLAWNPAGEQLLIALPGDSAFRPGTPVPLGLLNATTGQVTDTGQKIGSLWGSFDSAGGIAACFIADQDVCQFGTLSGGSLSLSGTGDTTYASQGPNGKWLIDAADDSLTVWEPSGRHGVTRVGYGDGAWSSDGLLVLVGSGVEPSSDLRALTIPAESAGMPVLSPHGDVLYYFRAMDLPTGRRVEAHLVRVGLH